MVKHHILNVLKREKTGKEAAKKVKKQGYIPAVAYGYKGSRVFSVRSHEFEKIFNEIGEHSIITLNIEDGEKFEAIVKGFQLDPVKKEIIHLDFYEIEKGKLLRTEVPVKITGISRGIKKGGILETFLTDVEIECFPKDIPECIEVDITELDLGQSLHVRDLKIDEKIKIISNPEQVVLTIGVPTKRVQVVAEEEEAEAVEGVISGTGTKETGIK